MVKSIKYILKRIIIGVGIALALMLIKGNLLIGVNAQTIELGTPQTSGNYSGGNWPLVNAPINQSGYFSSYNISDYPTTGGVYFEWANANLCSGQNMTFSGTAQVYRNGVANLGVTSINGYFTGWGNQKTCTFSQNGNSIDFSCTGPGGGSFILYYNYDNVVASNGSTLTINTPINVNITCEASNNDVIQNNTQNTNNIINNQNNNTSIINNSIEENSNNIINNQNENTEKEIESQKVCNTKTYYFDSLPSSNSGFLTGYDAIYNGTSAWRYSNYIPVNEGEIIVVSNQNVSSAKNCFYNSDKVGISCYLSNSGTTIIPSGAAFVRFNIERTSSNYTTIKSCQNGNQAIADSQQDINNSLNDDNGVSDSDINDLFGELEESDTPISDLVLMPLTLLNAYLQGFNSSCQSINIGSLFGTDLIFPCINIESYIGSSLWGVIDALISLFMIFNIGQLIITAFDGITSLNDDFQVLYGGRHVAAPSSRVERNSDLY